MPFSEFKDFKLHTHNSPPPIIVSSPPASLSPLSQEERQKENQVSKAVVSAAKPVQPLKSAMRNKETKGEPKQVHWDSKAVNNERNMQPRKRATSTRPSLSSPINTHYTSTVDASPTRSYPQTPEYPTNSPSKIYHSDHYQISQTADSSFSRSLPWASKSSANSPSKRCHSQRHQHSRTANTSARRESVSAHLSVEIGSRSPHVAPARSQVHHKVHQIPPRVPDAPKRCGRTPVVSPKPPQSVKPKPTQNEDYDLLKYPMPRRILSPETRQQGIQTSLLSSKSRRPAKSEVTQGESSGPPPTPRPRRLPSPDLPDIGCGPFCECCKTKAPYYFPEPRYQDHNPQKWEYQRAYSKCVSRIIADLEQLEMP